MASDNTVIVTGNITRDPEVRSTKGGANVTSFGLAVNRRWQNRDTQEWEEQVSFVDVTVWNDMGDNVAASLYKGDRCTVVGRLEQQSWETDNGDKRSKIQIVADDVSVSLRWATVGTVEKVQKDQGGRGGGGRPASAGGRPAASGGRPASAGGRGGGGRQQAAPDFTDEEPF